MKQRYHNRDVTNSGNDKWEHLYTQFLHEIVDTQIFCEHNLTLTRVAAILGTNTNYVSNCINKTVGKSFSEHIAMLRVEEFLRRFDNEQTETIEDMALKCGFGSRSSFYRTFKNAKGCSPLEWIERFKSKPND